jgi:glutamate synthase (NADPH/NADH) small chain
MEYQELFSAGDLCIQEEPAYCTNKCPLNVDVRTIMTYVQEGDFTKAYKIYSKQAVFPHILSRLCDEPCRDACLRNRVDEAVSIRQIERACVEYADPAHSTKYALPRKNKRICIIGGGLSGLSCAVNLARKGYQVAIYEKEGRLGGCLWELDSRILPAHVISQELEQLLADEDFITVYHQKVEDLSSLEGDAIYVATGVEGDTFSLSLSQDGRPIYNSISLESSHKGIFVGGSLIRTRIPSAILSIAEGIRAARSIECYLKGASLTSERSKEETKLVTEIPDTGKKAAVLPQNPLNGYSKKEAIEEAKRCYLCECKICVRACEYLTYYREYPRKYISDILQTVKSLEGVGGKAASRLVSSCNLCGLCKELCPTKLDMSDVSQSSRRFLQRAGKMPPVFYDFWLRDMQFSTSERAYLSQNPPGTSSSSYMFFPGCQMGASNPEYIKKAYAYLTNYLQGGVALTLSCCGAPAEWAGDEKLHAKMLKDILNNWQQFGQPKVILACPTCSKMFRKYLPDIETQSLWSIIEEKGLPKEASDENAKTVAVYDPCSSRYDEKTQKCIRKLLNRLNYRIVELPYHGRYAQCCSYGGLINVVNPELAGKIIQKRIATSPYNYVTYCTNCRDTFAANGKPTWHILDLLFGETDEKVAAKKPPSLSQRRYNRSELKTYLLRDIWGIDEKKSQKEYEGIRLYIADKLLDKMDQQLILDDDVKKVIYWAEKTGVKLFDNKNKHYIAHFRETVFTYWVEYCPKDSGYEIINVYSHRLQLEENEI